MDVFAVAVVMPVAVAFANDVAVSVGVVVVETRGASEIDSDGSNMVLHDLGVGGKWSHVRSKGDLRVELQKPGATHHAKQEKARSLALLLSPPPTTFEAAKMQRSPAIPGPEDGADLEPPSHDTPPQVEAAEHPDCQSRKQIRAPTDVGEPLESLRGEASWRAMGQMSPTSAHASEGKTPIREVHGRPPDLPNLQTQGRAVLAPGSVEPMVDVRATQARMPVPDEGGRVRLGPWPNLEVFIINLDSCLGSASLLEGEQNIFLPRVGSKQYASPCISQIFLFPTLSSDVSPLDTLARKNPPDRRERAPPPNSVPPTSALNAGNCPTCVLKTWRNQESISIGRLTCPLWQPGRPQSSWAYMHSRKNRREVS